MASVTAQAATLKPVSVRPRKVSRLGWMAPRPFGHVHAELVEIGAELVKLDGEPIGWHWHGLRRRFGRFLARHFAY